VKIEENLLNEKKIFYTAAYVLRNTCFYFTEKRAKHSTNPLLHKGFSKRLYFYSPLAKYKQPFTK
jgi:hypothetical protein